MIPMAGQFVDIVFRNSIKLSGKVVYWSDEESIIENKGTIVIKNTAEDILFFIIRDQSYDAKDLAAKIAERIEEEKQSAVTPEKLPTIAALKKEYIKQEKESISDSFKDSEFKKQTTLDRYESPFGTQQEPSQHPTKKTSGEVNRNIGILQNMFRKKEK